MTDIGKGGIVAAVIVGLVGAVGFAMQEAYRSGVDDGYAEAQSAQAMVAAKMNELGYCRWAEVMAEQWGCAGEKP